MRGLTVTYYAAGVYFGEFNSVDQCFLYYVEAIVEL